ncbi:MAG: extracellular solute-binding protein [Caldilineaceae bacterium SB0661_bin_32]|uniref:Extracellular solute-binding protein n=1 Tax=Caldilineaceae bacterium SB0661_bin_32 TaxID=2605255 RepID=A0A6B1DAG2_9CHLR|nr:extracellular solute-binding protein [Caldilineaceae bacterium SB0661_bin_32]
MPIQRSLRASSEVKPGGSILRRCAANRCAAPRRLPFRLWLLMVALLLNGCDALPSRPRLPELPFLQLRGESDAAAPPLHVFLPEEGDVTEALRSRVVAWAAASELQVNLTASDQYDQELVSRLAGEDPPDMVLVTAFLFPELAAGGLLAPAEEGFLEPADLPPRLAAAFTWPREEAAAKRYCLPREVRTLALVYDGEGLAAAGHPPPASWDSLRAVAVGQTDVDRNRFGFIEAPDLSRWLPFLYGAGGTIIEGSGGMALESPAAEAAMDWYIQIFRDNFAGHAGESNNEWAGEVLGKGKGGLTVEGNWIAPYFEAEFPDFRYGVAPLPSGPAGLNSSVAFTSCYAVSSKSGRKQNAFALAAFLSGPDVVGSLPNDGGWMPALNGLREEWKRTFPRLAPFADAVPTAAVWQLPPGFDTFLHSFNRGMVQLFAANVEAADFFAELQELGETLLETAGEPQPAPAATQDSSP